MKAEDVAAFLKRNPSFFEANSEVLAALTLPHEDPFQERQIAVLRERSSRERLLHEEFVRNARQNEILEQKVHELACRLLARDDWTPDSLTAMLKEFFTVDEVRFCLIGDHGLPESEFEVLFERVRHGGSICDDRMSSSQLTMLFGADNSIQSCAFVPVSVAAGKGVLILAADDRDRFKTGIGVVYLDRVGELLSATLSRRQE